MLICPRSCYHRGIIYKEETFGRCTDYASQGSYCVPYYQCHNGTVITGGTNPVKIEVNRGTIQGLLSPKDSKCPGFLNVCCKGADVAFYPRTRTTVNVASKCGRRHKYGLGVEIQGFNNSESQFGEWPHMCAILKEEKTSQAFRDSQQCGGSLIAPGVILTAAQCVDKFQENPTELTIRCGEWDTKHQTEPRPHQDREVQALKIHPEFDSKSLHNDWAVLFTSQNFDLQDHIDTICLPHPKDIFVGESCFATGWGKDQYGEADKYEVVLKEFELHIVPQEQCEAVLKQTRLDRYDSFICAGGEGDYGNRTCKGDIGSPLVCPSKSDPRRFVQAGLISWGTYHPCGMYPSVAEAVCWIDDVVTKQLGKESGCFRSYFGLEFDDCLITWS